MGSTTFPSQTVVPITLLSPANAAAFDQLARFYGRFGFAWGRPADGWKRNFASKPMPIDALKQYPEELLANVRRVELTAGLTAMIDRMLEADDDRRMATVQHDQLYRWRTISFRLNMLGYGIAAFAGLVAAQTLLLP